MRGLARALALAQAWQRVARHVVVLLAALGAVAPALHAQQEIDWSRRPVLLLTMGQGDEVFEKFGHNAIVVWDDTFGQPLVYNWGMFDFDQPNFIGRFLTGDTRYWMEPVTMEQTLRQYRALNRTVSAQELQLTPSQSQRLVRTLAENALEANRYYRYDYYRDNCSTRARDAIDAVTGGVLGVAMRAQPGQGSYRWHTRRLLAYSTPLYLGSQLVLGVDSDALLTGWEEAFLPASLAASVRRIELPAAEGLPVRPLAVDRGTLYTATRAAEPAGVAPRIGIAVVIGVLLGAVLLGAVRLGRRSAALAMIVWAVLCSAVGSVLLLAWFATRHVYMSDNPSVAVLNPAWLLAAVAAVSVWRRGAPRGLRHALRWLLLMAVIGTAGAVLRGHAVSAIEIAAAVLPGHAAIVYAADRYRRESAGPQP